MLKTRLVQIKEVRRRGTLNKKSAYKILKVVVSNLFSSVFQSPQKITKEADKAMMINSYFTKM